LGLRRYLPPGDRGNAEQGFPEADQPFGNAGKKEEKAGQQIARPAPAGEDDLSDDTITQRHQVEQEGVKDGEIWFQPFQFLQERQT
jgi:hypothetical protein